ncbi:MotA/TolQ/ExbB proton channel family protein [Aliivibrio salmonicida]|uniref:MotA/TolQ/ExbB proton channel family protein n=1 Tax=Aliivibrio salmonicida TaxID=40269 RepID=UPI00406D357C
MLNFSHIYSQLGIMALPLLTCSLVTLALLIERSIQLLLFSGSSHRSIKKSLVQLDKDDEHGINSLIMSLRRRRSLSAKGNAMLLAHRNFTKTLREDVAGLWLQEKRYQLHSGLRLLSLIGMISPLLGLLGTVLGLIDMFKEVAATTGSITPNILADGLGLAMRTTAIGLMIALPAISSAQLLGLWADRIFSRLEHSLNFTNLWIEGVFISSEPQHTLDKTVKPDSKVTV